MAGTGWGQKEALPAARGGSERPALQWPRAERRSGQGGDTRSLVESGRGLGARDSSNEMLSVSSQRFPWVSLAERATERSCWSWPWPAADWSGAEKEQPETQEEAQARKRRSLSHTKVTNGLGTDGGRERRRGKGTVGVDGSVKKFASEKLMKVRTGSPEAKPKTLMSTEPRARGAPGAAPPRGRGGLSDRPRPRAVSPWLWLHLPAGRAVDPPGLQEGTG